MSAEAAETTVEELQGKYRGRGPSTDRSRAAERLAEDQRALAGLDHGGSSVDDGGRG